MKTLADEASAAGITWKYYAPVKGTFGYIWSTMDAVRHIRYSSLWQTMLRGPCSLPPTSRTTICRR